MRQAPIIVLGAARSGAGLLARILGASENHFLITDRQRHLKERLCPEDRSGESDELLWWKHFEFSGWDPSRNGPLDETPIFDAARIEALRDHYLDLAQGKRLVIKNAHSLVRLPVLRRMFPEAAFVFALRSPWPTIQSVAIGGDRSDVARTPFVNGFADDLLLRAAATWAEAIDILGREHDRRWIVVPHETLVAEPKDTVFKLYHRLGIDEFETAVSAATLPVERPRDYAFIKGELFASPHRFRILGLVAPRAWSLGYAGVPFALAGSGLRRLLTSRGKPRAEETAGAIEVSDFLPTTS